MAQGTCAIGMVGLGVMGRNLLLNIADHGFPCAGMDLDAEKVALLRQEAAGKPVTACRTAAELVAALKSPRSIMLLVPAGKAVDGAISSFLPLLAPDDLIIDGGNSHFADTARRERDLTGKGLKFLGVGVSGGESGARHGPSLMPGGSADAYERVKPIFEAVAARANGEPCVAFLGRGAAGHYVKMVHNGIEYGLMQLIAETYDILRQRAGLSAPQIADVFDQWNKGELSSFLIEITATVLRKIDDKTGKPLVDVIRDAAKQKGTGKWTSQEALDLGVPTPTLDAAVTARNLSGLVEQRRALAAAFAPPSPANADVVAQCAHALFTATVLTYAQGLALLSGGSAAHDYGLDLAAVTRVWRAGCIIRAKLLESLTAAYRRDNSLTNPFLDRALAESVAGRIQGLRSAVSGAAASSIPVPALSASLAYIDSLRAPRLPANLIQAQRDFFGAHTYERTDMPGTFHSDWSS